MCILTTFCRSVRLYCMFGVVERYNNNPTLTNVPTAENHFHFVFTYQIYPFHDDRRQWYLLK